MAAYVPLYTTAAGVYAKTGLSSAECDLSVEDTSRVIMEAAENELHLLTGSQFDGANTATEYFSFKQVDALGNYATRLQLAHHPVLSISEFLILNTDGTAQSTFAPLTDVNIAAGVYFTVDYWLETQHNPITQGIVCNGGLKLQKATFPPGTNNVRVAYTYGYTVVPVIIKDLAECLCGVRMWVKFLGGGYNRLNSYSVPEQNVNKGDFYERGKANIALLQDEANRILDLVGRRSRRFFFSSGDLR